MKINKFIAISCLIFLSACALPRPSSGPGFIYTDTIEGIFANNDVEISRIGKSCNSNILGIASSGNASIDYAKRMGNITNVATIDREFHGYLGIYATSCTIVKGN